VNTETLSEIMPQNNERATFPISCCMMNYIMLMIMKTNIGQENSKCIDGMIGSIVQGQEGGILFYQGGVD
jgi:hypothetical protein